MQEFKDQRLKYVDLPNMFHVKTGEIDIASKQHLRTCGELAKRLSRQKPKDPKEFEQHEWMKDFIMKTASLNEKTISLLEYLAVELSEIAQDAKFLSDGALGRDIIKDQQEAIIAIQQVRDSAINSLYELGKTKRG